MWVSSIMGLDKRILPDGRNRPGGNMTSVSVIGNLILPDGRNRLGGYMTTISVIGNNDGWWNELEHNASTRQSLPNGKNYPT